MYFKSKNIIVITGINTNDLIKTVFNSRLSEYEYNLFGKMKSRDLVFGYIDKAYFTCHEINLKRNRS